MLCQDFRVFDAMMSAGTPCPYEGKIGDEAKKQWTLNPHKIPKESTHFKKKVSTKIVPNGNTVNDTVLFSILTLVLLGITLIHIKKFYNQQITRR